MSEWEKLDFAIQIVRSQIEYEGGVVTGYTNTPSVVPNIWFEKGGRKCFTIVVYSDDAMCKLNISAEIKQLMEKYDGFYACFSFPEFYRGKEIYVKPQGFVKPLTDLLRQN